MTQSEIPVYQQARHLVLQIMASTKHVPVWVKREKLQRYHDLAFDIMLYVSYANLQHTPVERMEYLSMAITALEELKIGIRIIFDLGFISKSGLSAIIKLEDNVSRQLQGWLAKTRKEVAQGGNGTNG